MVQDNDDIIELTQVVEDASSTEEDQEIIELTQIDVGEDHLSKSGTADDEAQAAFVPGTDDDSGGESTLGVEGDPLASVSREDLETALERVIEKKFAGTIEKILFEVTEQVIQKEIANIRTDLQKDLDNIGNA